MENNYYSVCIGEVGAGKSSFINSVLKYGNKYNKDNMCKTDKSWKGVTKELNMKYIDIRNNRFYFIDTPGLNEAKVDEENKKRLRDELSGDIENMSRIRCILLIMKISDYRLTIGIQNIIIELMNCFPSPKFWDHVLIIRTHCFDQSQIEDIKGNIEDIIQNDDDIKAAMKKKGIKFPKELKEFYVNSVDSNKNVNSDKIGNILTTIQKIDPLYQNVSYSGIKSRKEGNIIIKYKTMSFQEFGKNETYTNDIIIDVEGADDTIHERVGSPYKRTCKKGYWQDWQTYIVKYDKDGRTIKNKVPIGKPRPEPC